MSALFPSVIALLADGLRVAYPAGFAQAFLAPPQGGLAPLGDMLPDRMDLQADWQHIQAPQCAAKHSCLLPGHAGMRSIFRAPCSRPVPVALQSNSRAAWLYH